MRRLLVFGVISFTAIGAASLWASARPQTGGGGQKSLTFDTASIKVDTSGIPRNSLDINMEGGRLHAVNVPLSTFVIEAYKIPPNRIVGAPSWFGSEYFDVEATHSDPGPDDPSTDDGNDLRVQALLADRFKLAVHHETRQMPVYDLILAAPGKLGPNMQLNNGNCGEFHQTDLTKPSAAAVAGSTPGSINCGDFSSYGGSSQVRLLARGVSVSKLIEVISGHGATSPFVTRPIVDRTGITGKVDFTLEFAPAPRGSASNAPSAPDPSSLPSLETALRGELGLELKSDTGPVDVLVIDHVEQPSAN